MRLSKKLNILAILVFTISLFSQTVPVRAAFPGQNGNIAYTDLTVIDNGNGGANFSLSLKDMSSAGTNSRAIGGDGKFFSPRYSADGTKLTATGPLDPTGNGLANIHVMNADGSSPVNVTNINQADFPGRQNYVASFSSFHPNGTKLAYGTIWEEDDGNGGTTKMNRINTINTDGSNKQELTTSPANTCDVYPVFSPDGNKIAFLRGENGTNIAGIYTMNADGSDQQQIVSISTPQFRCVASDEIFYAGFSPSSFPLQGSQPSSIDWSPDGNHLVYMEGSSVDNGSIQTLSNAIYTSDLSGNKSLVKTISSSIDNSLYQNPPEVQPPDIQADSMMGVQYTPDGRLIFKSIHYTQVYIYPDGGSQWEDDNEDVTLKSTISMINTDGSDQRMILQGDTVSGEIAEYQIYVHMLPTVQPLIASPKPLLASTGTYIWPVTMFALSTVLAAGGLLVVRRQRYAND